MLLADGRSVLAGVDQMRARAKGMSSGTEAELSVVIDVMFPIAIVAQTSKAFGETFPVTPLKIYVEVLGSAYQPLLDGRASLGIVGPMPSMASCVTCERLTGIRMVIVAAPIHPLAEYPGTIPRADLARYVQLVLTDRTALTDRQDFCVFSRLTWRLADLFAKRAFLLEGLG